MKVLKSMLLLLAVFALVTTFLACDNASGGGTVTPPVVIPEGSMVQYIVLEGEFADMLDEDMIKSMLGQYDWIPRDNELTYDVSTNTATFASELSFTQANFDELPFDASYNGETKTLTLDVGGMIPVAHVVFVSSEYPIPTDYTDAKHEIDDSGFFQGDTTGEYEPSTGTYTFSTPNQFPFLLIQMYPPEMIEYDEDTDTLTLFT